MCTNRLPHLVSVTGALHMMLIRKILANVSCNTHICCHRFPHILSEHAGIPLSVIRSAEEDSKAGYMLVEKSISLPVYSDA